MDQSYPGYPRGRNAGNIWKYVDDTTTSEIVVKGASSNSQLIADTVVQWSFENRLKLNSEKCKELRISFAKNKPQLAPIVVNTVFIRLTALGAY